MRHLYFAWFRWRETPGLTAWSSGSYLLICQCSKPPFASHIYLLSYGVAAHIHFVSSSLQPTIMWGADRTRKWVLKSPTHYISPSHTSLKYKHMRKMKTHESTFNSTQRSKAKLKSKEWYFKNVTATCSLTWRTVQIQIHKSWMV